MPKEPRDFHEEARRFDQRLALLELMIDHDKARPGSDEKTKDDALIAEAKSSLMHDLFPSLHPERPGNEAVDRKQLAAMAIDRLQKRANEASSPEDHCSAAAPEEETRVPLDLAIKLLRYGIASRGNPGDRHFCRTGPVAARPHRSRHGRRSLEP